MHRKKLAAAISIACLVPLLDWSCSGGPVDSETLSNALSSGPTTLRSMVFGILTLGENKQMIMVEDARNNVKDFYRNDEKMTVTGSISDGATSRDLDIFMLRVKDPFQIPEIFDVYDEFERRMWAALGEEDTVTAEYWTEQRIALEAGLTRWIHWLTTDKMEIREKESYSIDLKLIDEEFPDVEIEIEETTTMPGNFDIIYPVEGMVIEPTDVFKLRWSESDGAAGYRIIATTPLSTYKKFETVVKGASFDLHLFFKERAPYTVQVWALDHNYFNFLSQRLERQRVKRTHFFDFGEMNLSMIAVFGSRVMRTVDFTIE